MTSGSPPPDGGPDLRATGERIEALLEAASTGGRVARERAEELVRLVVDLYGAGLERLLEIVHEAGRLDDDLLDTYAEGRPLTPALAASVEAHLERCSACQLRLVPSADLPRLDAVWAEVEDTLDAPRPGLLERLLLRAGVASDTARLVAVTPSLQRSWITGTVLALTLALLVAHSGERGVAMFLALAPVLPVAGIAVAFGPRTDPFHEVALAAPYSSFRLLLVRSAAVLAATTALAVPVTLLLPSTPLVAAAWLLPALALAVTSLALATRIDPVVSSERLLYRLFHERGVRVFEGQAVREACSCSHTRIMAMMRRFSPEDRRDMVGDNGRIGITCEFCSRVYDLDPAVVEAEIAQPETAAD